MSSRSLLSLMLLFAFGANCTSLPYKVSDISKYAGYFEEKFNETIQCLQTRLIEKLYDPFRCNRPLYLNLDNKVIYTRLELTNLVVDGILDFRVTNVNFNSEFQLDVAYSLDTVIIRSNHCGYLNLLGLVGINTDGDLNLTIAGLKIHTSTWFNKEPPLVSNLTLKVSLDSFDIKLSGLLNDEDYSAWISQIMSKYAPEIINSNNEYISAQLSPSLLEHSNKYVGHLTLLDFLEEIVNVGCTFPKI